MSSKLGRLSGKSATRATAGLTEKQQIEMAIAMSLQQAPPQQDNTEGACERPGSMPGASHSHEAALPESAPHQHPTPEAERPAEALGAAPRAKQNPATAGEEGTRSKRAAAQRRKYALDEDSDADDGSAGSQGADDYEPGASSSESEEDSDFAEEDSEDERPAKKRKGAAGAAKKPAAKPAAGRKIGGAAAKGTAATSALGAKGPAAAGKATGGNATRGRKVGTAAAGTTVAPATAVAAVAASNAAAGKPPSSVLARGRVPVPMPAPFAAISPNVHEAPDEEGSAACVSRGTGVNEADDVEFAKEVSEAGPSPEGPTAQRAATGQVKGPAAAAAAVPKRKDPAPARGTSAVPKQPAKTPAVAVKPAPKPLGMTIRPPLNTPASAPPKLPSTTTVRPLGGSSSSAGIKVSTAGPMAYRVPGLRRPSSGMSNKNPS